MLILLVMGIVKVEIPGDFEITIEARDIDEVIEKMKEVKKEKALKLWEKIKEKNRLGKLAERKR